MLFGMAALAQSLALGVTILPRLSSGYITIAVVDLEDRPILPRTVAAGAPATMKFDDFVSEPDPFSVAIGIHRNYSVDRHHDKASDRPTKSRVRILAVEKAGIKEISATPLQGREIAVRR